jgi:hypothetical protein
MTFVQLLSMALPPEQTRAALRLLSRSQLSVVRLWFDRENEMTDEIDTILDQRKAEGRED